MKSMGIFLFLLFLETGGFSQGLYKPGYIITNNNDTIYGEIKEKEFNPKSSIKFKISQADAVEYTPNDIKGYSIKNGISYMSIKTHSGSGFGVIQVDGYLRLVYIEIYSERGYIPNSGYGKTAGTYGTELLYSNHKIFRNGEEVFYVSRKTFNDRTAEFFSDYPELQQKISKRNLKYGDIKTIVKTYNDWHNKNLLSL